MNSRSVSQALSVGDVVAERFELAALAGQGAMGIVWRAVDRATGHVVALKMLRHAHEDDAERLVREARTLREVAHPGVVKHVADGTDASGWPWLAMEWLEGEDLGAMLRRGPIGFDATLAMGVAVAEALSALHEARLVHRDLKPGNVWLVEGDCRHVKLLDLGVVRFMDDNDDQLTSHGTIIGTPSFMSPEQVRGEATGPSSDLFSLGSLLYACATGASPFRGATFTATLARVLLDEPAPIRRVRPELPRRYERLICALLSKDPTQRPTSSSAVAESLRSLRCEDRTFDEPPPPSVVLGGREQRWLCVLMVRGNPRGADDELPTIVADRTLAEAGFPLEIGARVESLRDGSRVFVWTGAEGAAQLARRAGREALLLGNALGTLDRALAMGHGSVGDVFPVGDAVDRAARLLEESRGELVLDGALAQLLGRDFDVRSDGARFTLGEPRPIGAAAPTLLGVQTPCIGREVELAALEESFARVLAQGTAAAMIVTGDAGVGKSRLRQQWVTSVRAGHRDATIWQAQGDSVSQGAAFGVISQLVRDACGVPPGAEGEELRGRIAASVASVMDEARRPATVASLVGLFGSAVECQGRPERRDPTVVGDQIRAAWEDFLVASCAQRPVLIVVDDLEWSDGPSLALIDRALRNYRDRRWMIVAFGGSEHRERHPKLWSERGVRELLLPALQVDAAERLVRTVLGGSASDARVAAVVARAEGNAFLLEELVRAEAEGRGESTPETVLAMVEARLVRLDPRERRTLRAASVFGQRFDARGVATVLGDNGAAVVLESLVQKEWVANVHGEVFAFRHLTARDAAYAMLVDEDKRIAHGFAAAFLASRPDSDPAAIAEHFVLAGERHRASAFWARASLRALEANDARASIASAEAAEHCGAAGHALIEALSARAEASMFLGEIQAQLHSAERLGSASVGEPTGLAIGLRWEANAALRLGDTKRVVDVIARAERLLAEAPELDAVVEAGFGVAASGLQGGLVRQADGLAASARAALRLVDVRGERVRAREMEWNAARQVRSHDHESGASLYAEAAMLYERAGMIRHAAGMRANAGWALQLIGDFAGSLTALERSLVEITRLGVPDLMASVKQNLGRALSVLGRHEEAIAAQSDALAAYVAQRNKRQECVSRVYVSRARLAAGDAEAAVVEAEVAFGLLPQDHPWTHYARAALASALVVRGLRGDASRALEMARPAGEMLRASPELFTTPAPILRACIDALAANGLLEEASVLRVEARRWALARAAELRSDGHRYTFLHDEPDVARILGNR